MRGRLGYLSKDDLTASGSHDDLNDPKKTTREEDVLFEERNRKMVNSKGNSKCRRLMCAIFCCKDYSVIESDRTANPTKFKVQSLDLGDEDAKFDADQSRSKQSKEKNVNFVMGPLDESA